MQTFLFIYLFFHYSTIESLLDLFAVRSEHAFVLLFLAKVLDVCALFPPLVLPAGPTSLWMAGQLRL